MTASELTGARYACLAPSHVVGVWLEGMGERAALMGGELEIETSSAGTVIAAAFPL